MPKKAKPDDRKGKQAAEQTARRPPQRLLRKRGQSDSQVNKANPKNKLLRPDKTQSRGWRRPGVCRKDQRQRDWHGLTETIVNYRLMLGERAGLSAVEVLAQIAVGLATCAWERCGELRAIAGSGKGLTAR